MATMAESIDEALEATKGQSAEVQAAAVSAAVLAPDRATANWLWRVLVAGLVVVLILSMAGVIWSVLDGSDKTSPDVIVTVFTAVLTGLIGLFVKSPAQG